MSNINLLINKPKMKTVEIYFKDLKEDKQKEILEATNLQDGDDGNMDISPLFTYEVEEDEDE